MSRVPGAGPSVRIGNVLVPGVALTIWTVIGLVALFATTPAAGVIVAFTIVVAAVAVGWDRRRRRRSDSIARWAAANGWDYDSQSALLLSRWTVPPFGRSGRREARDVLRKEIRGVPVTSFTFSVVTDTVADMALIGERHVLMTELPVRLPALTLTPEGSPRRHGALGLLPDIELESGQFNDRWRVQCADRRFAYALCHPRLMARLLEDDARHVSVLVEGCDVGVHAPGPTDVERLEERAALLADVAGLVPPYVAADRPPAPPKRHRRDRGRGL